MSMISPHVEVQLRSGGHCLIRRATIDDAAGLLDLDRAIVRARDGIVQYEDELAADAAAYAERHGPHLTATDGSVLPLVAEMEGRGLVGEGSIVRFKLRMVRHVGKLGLGVHPAAQGLGVGRALMEQLLAWARAHRDEDGGRVERVELYVRADNARAIALYRSMGFALEGTRRGFVRRDDGALIDDLVMGLLLLEGE
jgi:putative acetyltransferase